MKLRQLQTFAAVVGEGSFRRAAETLYLTQPAVSQQIQALERSLGFRLIDRGTCGIRLTPDGAQVYERVKAVLLALADLDDLTRQITRGEAGCIDLGATLTATEWLLPRLLAAFRERFPGIEISVRILNPQAISNALTERSIQLGTLQEVPSSYESLELRRHTLVGIVAPSWSEMTPPSTLLVRERGSDLREAVDAWLTTTGITFSATMEFASNSALREGASAGLGCAILSTDVVGFELAAGLVQIIDLPGMPVHRKWRLAWEKGRRLSPAVSNFIEFCRSPEGEAAIYS